ncbi:hypothetical protein [Janibacter sp. G1551]|uniref:hypothetical protein n=1 Tax=Janibacter sp. G1551 TaxID=3420440 RepID=UPI003D083885
MGALRTLATGAVAAAGGATAFHALRAASPGGRERWERTNHAGHTVSLTEGPAYVVGVLVGVAASAALGGPAPAAVIAATGSGAVGLVDDLVGDTGTKGFRGHLRALRQGRVTTGSVKILGLAATGTAVALCVDADRDGGVLARSSRALLGGAVVAGGANLVNLLDLRPGRALKATAIVGTLVGAAGGGGAAAPAAVGAALGLLPADLRREGMLGDAGANAAGALVATALLERSGTRARLLALGVLAALTLASEKVSFTAVIESTPGLRELDAWGRD